MPRADLALESWDSCPTPPERHPFWETSQHLLLTPQCSERDVRRLSHTRCTALHHCFRHLCPFKQVASHPFPSSLISKVRMISTLYLIELAVRRLNHLTWTKCLEQCLEASKCSVRISAFHFYPNYLLLALGQHSLTFCRKPGLKRSLV